MILGSVGLIAFAFFASKDAIGYTFATNGLQLQVDSHATYNGVVQPALSWELKDLVPGVDKFFNFDNVLPGDEGVTTISLHTDQNAWACMDFTNLTDEDNGNNEPESPEDPDGPAGGELSKGMEFFGWVDDGDYAFEPGEEAIFGTSTPQAAFDALAQHILADASTGSFFPANVTKYIGIQWCAGDLEVNEGTGDVSCDGSVLGNIAQSDSFSVDLGLRVVTADDYPGYRCDGSVPPPPTGPTVTLNLEKKFSGPVPEGYLPQQFTFHVVGPSVDQIVTLIPYTQDSANGTIELEEGEYEITEIGPVGFIHADWRPGWYGECESGSEFSTTITIDEDNIEDGTLYCQVDNQYRPENNNGNNGHGNDADGNDNSNQGASNDPEDDTDDDGVPPGQLQTISVQQTGVSDARSERPSRLDRIINSVRSFFRR